jgi:hypothetical protein
VKSRIVVIALHNRALSRTSLTHTQTTGHHLVTRGLSTSRATSASLKNTRRRQAALFKMRLSARALDIQAKHKCSCMQKSYPAPSTPTPAARPVRTYVHTADWQPGTP